MTRDHDSQSTQQHFVAADNAVAQTLWGEQNQHLRLVEQLLDLRIGAMGSAIHISGPRKAVALAVSLFTQLEEVTADGYPLSRQDVVRALDLLTTTPGARVADYLLKGAALRGLKRPIQPKSHAQKQYVDAMTLFDVVFGIGPAGTGKTYLAVAMGLSLLKQKKVQRLVLCRPAVEAGEKLGFLPGSLVEKVDPYLRPLYDALYDMADTKAVQDWMAEGVIEVAPLAYMRGRTLNRSFVILDEAQNTTAGQMKMFLTRMGNGSKMVVTGDDTQVDLPDPAQSGLLSASRALGAVQGVAFCRFTAVDVMRHPLVQAIIDAYEAQGPKDEG